jgi:signal transduction histidine kinase
MIITCVVRVDKGVTESLQEIRGLIDANQELDNQVRLLTCGERLLDEATVNKCLWLVLDGSVRLTKHDTEQMECMRFDAVGPGELIGILTYFTGESSFFGAEAETDSRVFGLPWTAFAELPKKHPRLHALMEQCIRDSFSRRYRRLVELHMDNQRLTDSLQKERAQLQQTVNALEEAHDRLRSQEKLALLGSVLPGIAHELNNPAAALVRTADYLDPILQETFAQLDQRCESLLFWQAGAQAPIIDSRAQRQQMQTLEAQLPDFSRALLRRLSAMPTEMIARMLDDFSELRVQSALRAFEAGRFMHTLRTAGRRIARLVESLKRYARSDQAATGKVDLTVNLRDTLLILASRLRNTKINTEIANTPCVYGNEDEFNQIWTNLICNAIDAMEEGGELTIRTREKTGDDGKAGVEVLFADRGPGIPPVLREKIFTPNYTTKGRGGDFGLGLGLHIARTIVEEYGGTIRCEDNPPKGTCFYVWLPQQN